VTWKGAKAALFEPAFFQTEFARLYGLRQAEGRFG
jgi:hypothetical protein